MGGVPDPGAAASGSAWTARWCSDSSARSTPTRGWPCCCRPCRGLLDAGRERARAAGGRRPPGGGAEAARRRARHRQSRSCSPAAFRTAKSGRYYDLIDVLVYPRLSMRLTELVTPLKPLEAMAQGRLLVASDVGGHRELIRPGETGMLFKAGDPDALAAAVLDLKRRRGPLAGAARRPRARFVETERNWKASVARYDGVYSRVLRAVAARHEDTHLQHALSERRAPRPWHLRRDPAAAPRRRAARCNRRSSRRCPGSRSRAGVFGEYAKHARAPREETRNGIRVLHPRYPLLPEGRHDDGARAARRGRAARARRDCSRAAQHFDLIDAHYFYPDGVAAAWLGRRLDRPVVITARGSDLNLIPRYALPRRMIQWAARQAAG